MHRFPRRIPWHRILERPIHRQAPAMGKQEQIHLHNPQQHLRTRTSRPNLQILTAQSDKNRPGISQARSVPNEEGQRESQVRVEAVQILLLASVA